MSSTFQTIKELVRAGKFRLSQHGEEEMTEDGILLSELLPSLPFAGVVEDYPEAWKGPTVLLIHDFEGRRFHAIWGLSKATPNVATLVTAYLPDPAKWSADLKTRLKLMSDKITKTIREGNLMAEVKVAVIPDDNAWGPYISAEDALKLDRVRLALRRGDIADAAKEAKIFELHPVAAE